MPAPTAVTDLHAGMGHMELQRNVHISLRHRFVYFAVPKAANSTIKWLLQRAELADVTYEVRDIHDRQLSPLLAPYQLADDEFLGILRDAAFTVFTCVRNPYARLLSCFLDRVQAVTSLPRRQVAKALNQEPEDELDFAGYIEALTRIEPIAMNEHYRPQSLVTCAHWVEYDRVLRFESLQEELEPLLQTLYAGEDLSFPVQRNRSPKATGASDRVVEYFDDELAAKVQEVYADDFRYFGYDEDFRRHAAVGSARTA